jgi:hypothetical protein
MGTLTPSTSEPIMFGLIRTAILIFVAFVGGLFFERNQAGEACTNEGGEMHRGICRGVAR